MGLVLVPNGGGSGRECSKELSWKSHVKTSEQSLSSKCVYLLMDSVRNQWLTIIASSAKMISA
jgi:hypothetical protein